MKNFKKLALVLGVAGVSVGAMAANVSIVFPESGGVTPDPVVYSYGGMEVNGANGAITITNATYTEGTFPGSDGTIQCDGATTTLVNGFCVGVPTVTCGANTTLTSGVCEAPAPVTCGTDTTLTNGVCEADAPDLTPPTLNITSSPSSLGDGVTSATVTFQFSRAVTGFSQTDVGVSPTSHTLTGFNQIDADTWQATLNRSGNSSGTAVITVNSNTYTGTNGVNGGGDTTSVTLVGGAVNVGNCTVPNGVEISTHPAVAAFGQGGSIIEFYLPRRPTVWSAAFTTTNNTVDNGTVNMGGTTATVEHTREMWISECPGGAPLGGQSRCASVGQDHTLLWVQRSLRTACQLEPDTQYYFNIAYSPNDTTSCTNTSYCETIVQNLGGW
ncbi:Ig-like domain-containing protein [Gilvimarinus polysaccharolyticus]|uniref:Ig-like domain-containing protein n=1 Tax=Gilvimarinus polysaccharolyticus TaxID=863921 RepID=UPI000673BCB5|nr:Ig-like domain-containing protein [Gilvimarinus polysaccharolyticus]